MSYIAVLSAKQFMAVIQLGCALGAVFVSIPISICPPVVIERNSA